jgi:hypothetical protein
MLSYVSMGPSDDGGISVIVAKTGTKKSFKGARRHGGGHKIISELCSREAIRLSIQRCANATSYPSL